VNGHLIDDHFSNSFLDDDFCSGNETNEFSEYTMLPRGSISGTVYDAETGLPVPFVLVDIEYRGKGVCTDENGDYKITGLPYGTYNIAIGRDFCLPHAYIHQHIDGITINPTNPDVRGNDFFLEVGGSISGIVSDANGPAAFVWVEACTPDDSYCNRSGTGEDGNYTIHGLPAGNFRVSVWGRQDGWFDEFFNGQREYENADPVTVSVGVETRGIDFFMDPEGSISGNVSDANGPAAFVRVEACSLDDFFCNGSGTDKDGNYKIHGLPAGNYRVSVWGGHGGWRDQIYDGKVLWEDGDPVAVALGEDTGGIDFVMQLLGDIVPSWIEMEVGMVFAKEFFADKNQK
jgi:hypothetical protein